MPTFMYLYIQIAGSIFVLIFKNKVYQFRVLPFGLNTAPQIFALMGHNVAVLPPSSGISVILYLDDWLIHLQTLNMVGLGLNETKSELEPIQDIMGSLNWASGLISLGHLYLRPLQHFHSLGLTNQCTPPYMSDPLVLATLLRQWQDLSFLMSEIPIQPFQAEFTIFTDASTQGWGTYMEDSQIAGVWTRSECELHINVLDLKAVILALIWVAVLQGHHVMISTDNTTAVLVAYINKRVEPIPTPCRA